MEAYQHFPVKKSSMNKKSCQEVIPTFMVFSSIMLLASPKISQQFAQIAQPVPTGIEGPNPPPRFVAAPVDTFWNVF